MEKQKIKKIIEDEVRRFLEEITTTDDIAGYELPLPIGGPYECECLDCGFITTSDIHCRDMPCPQCGGEMRRIERPGIGYPETQVSTIETQKEEQEIKKMVRNELKEIVDKLLE